MKRCSNKRCKQVNPQVLDNFHKNKCMKDGLSHYCKSCNYERSHTPEYEENMRKYYRKHHIAHRKAAEKRGKAYHIHIYWPHLTKEEARAEYDKLFQQQNERCAICERPQSVLKYSLSVDHDHATGQVRGLLCHSCNRALGMLHDSSYNCGKAEKYLKKFNS